MNKILTLLTLSACLTFSLQPMENQTQNENIALDEHLIIAETQAAAKVLPSEVSTQFLDDIQLPIYYSFITPSQLEERTDFKKEYRHSIDMNADVTYRAIYSQGFMNALELSHKHINKNNLVIPELEVKKFKKIMYDHGFADGKKEQKSTDKDNELKEFKKGLAIGLTTAFILSIGVHYYTKKP